MSNNKQQTAVEWFGMEMGKLFAQYHGKIICIGEFHKKRFELEEQAKEMEKQRMIDAHINGQAEFDKGARRIKNDELAQMWYNETYGGNK